MQIILIVGGWIVCGVLAYGLEKGYWKKFYKTLNYVGYDRSCEYWCILIGLLGLIGLTSIVLSFLFERKKLRFCWRMPEQLGNKYRKEKVDKILNGYWHEMPTL